MERTSESCSQTSQIFACLCEICPITAVVCSAARCVSSCLSSSVTVVIWGLNWHFMFNYVSAKMRVSFQAFWVTFCVTESGFPV